MARTRIGKSILDEIGNEELTSALANGSSYRYDASAGRNDRNKKEAQEIEALKGDEQRRRLKEERDQATKLAKQRLLDDAELRASEKKTWTERIKEEHKALKENLKQQEEYLKRMEDAGIKSGEAWDAQRQKVNDAMMASTNAAMKELAVEVGDSLKSAAASAVKSVTNSMSKYLEEYQEYYSSINTRLQDAWEGMDFESLSSDIKTIVGDSPYVKYTAVMEELNNLVSAGTAVNLQERAFLASVSDKIATTFDALDSTLLRIVRLQETDTTAARLGMEASLTRLFNYYFSDTSYLSDAFDSVTQALLGLTSSLDAYSAVEYEYTIQKWLGALGSAGADSGTLTSIANAINALAIGDIDTLQSNQAMQNLLIMAANRQGLDYSSMLVNTPTQYELNELMYGIVDYIQEIMDTSNNVIRSQYASLFGITYSDIQAFMNISDEVMEDLRNSAMTYTDTLDELNYQLQQVANNRTSIAEQVNNVLDNVLAGTALAMFNNRGLYTTYAIADMVEGITGGIALPTVGVLGNFVGIANSIEELMKIGVTGAGLITSLFNGFTDWGLANALDLNAWNWSNFNYTKGEYTGYTSPYEMAFSSSNYGTVSNTSDVGVQQAMYDLQYSQAEEISGISLSTEESILDVVSDIRGYLEDGGSTANPLKVSLSSSEVTNTVTSSQTGAAETGNNILTLLGQILTALGKGETTDNALYVRNETTEQATNDIYKLLADYLPGSTLGGL